VEGPARLGDPFDLPNAMRTLLLRLVWFPDTSVDERSTACFHNPERSGHSGVCG
jgi:hypothetical protein